MKIEHIAVWTNNLEGLKDFYCEYFGGTSNEKYINKTKGFESYFVTFDEGARLEIMRRVDITEGSEPGKDFLGITHMAFKINGKEEVDTLTDKLRANGYTIAGEPRTTGDGYYESVVLDPDGNRIELVG